MSVIKGFVMSFSMFSIIPVPSLAWDEKSKRYIMLFFPFVGFVIGIIWYLVYTFFQKMNIGTGLEAFITMLVPYVLSGFLHVDGFADTCDAQFSHRDLERKREILKDSHIGAFGVIGLILLFMLSYVCAQSYSENLSLPELLIFIPVLSRCIAGISILRLKSLPASGLGSYFKSGRKNTDMYIILFYILAALVYALFWISVSAFLMSLLILFCGVCAVYYSYKGLDGFSGDLAGFAIVVTEVCAVLILSLS